MASGANGLGKLTLVTRVSGLPTLGLVLLAKAFKITDKYNQVINQ